MSTKMKKGILRPFRYFTNIMDTKEQQDMQIGFPTDVKHVAHIGWDGPTPPNTNKEAGAPSWMKDYHSAPLDSSSFRSDRGGSAAAASNPWASQEIVLDGAGLGDTSFRDTNNEAGNVDVTANDSPPSPGTRRSRRNRSRGSATSSIDVTGSETTEKEKEKEKEKKEKGKKGIRKNRKKDKEKAAEDTAGSTCQDLPAVPKKSNRRKNKGSSEGSGGASSKDTETVPEERAAPLPPVVEGEKDHEL